MEILPWIWITTPELIDLVPLKDVKVIWNFSLESIKLPSGMYKDPPKIVRIKESDNYNTWEDLCYKYFKKSYGQVLVWSGDEKISLNLIIEFLQKFAKNKTNLSSTRIGEWIGTWTPSMIKILKINRGKDNDE